MALYRTVAPDATFLPKPTACSIRREAVETLTSILAESAGAITHTYCRTRTQQVERPYECIPVGSRDGERAGADCAVTANPWRNGLSAAISLRSVQATISPGNLILKFGVKVQIRWHLGKTRIIAKADLDIQEVVK